MRAAVPLATALLALPLAAQPPVRRLDGSTISGVEIDATVPRVMRAAEVTGYGQKPPRSSRPDLRAPRGENPRSDSAVAVWPGRKSSFPVTRLPSTASEKANTCGTISGLA